MKKHALDVDAIAIDIEQANRLLYCFDDFCDYEGCINQNKSSDAQMIAALTFVERLEGYRSLLYAAHTLLAKSFGELNQLADELFKSGIGQAEK